jgi:hypothetical protein
LKIVTSYYPTPAYGGGRIVYIEPVFKLNDYIPPQATACNGEKDNSLVNRFSN